MCGVIYFQGDSEKNKELLVALFKESQVRGVHAFGIALRNRDEERFRVGRTFELRQAIRFMEDNTFYEMIGHCRYDTSGDWHTLENNQPVEVGRNLLVFNGVVRMSTRDQYQEEFEREYTTENDGEIPLRMFAEGKTNAAMKLLAEERVSFSGVIHVNGATMAIRNERRPLWYIRLPETQSQFIVSTYDIWKRALGRFKPRQMIVKELKPMEIAWLS